MGTANRKDIQLGALEKLRNENPTHRDEIAKCIEEIGNELLRDESVQITYSNRLRSLREKNHLTLSMVAGKIGTTPETVSLIE